MRPLYRISNTYMLEKPLVTGYSQTMTEKTTPTPNRRYVAEGVARSPLTGDHVRCVVPADSPIAELADGSRVHWSSVEWIDVRTSTGFPPDDDMESRDA